MRNHSGRTDGFVLRRLHPAHPALAPLAEESRREGFWMLVRLTGGGAKDGTLFRRRGETLLAAWRGEELAGVCGLGIDPHVDTRREGRVMHLYVRPGCRRLGAGRLLIAAVVEKARKYFPALNVRAPGEAFSFYEAVGFRRVESASATHCRRFVRRRSERRG